LRGKNGFSALSSLANLTGHNFNAKEKKKLYGN